MKHQDTSSKSEDHLWFLHEQVAKELTRRLAAAKAQLEQRLRMLGRPPGRNADHARRSYPRISILLNLRRLGRVGGSNLGGLQFRSGKKLDDFRIAISFKTDSVKSPDSRWGRTTLRYTASYKSTRVTVLLASICATPMQTGI
jgi:hypothetical protein